MMLCVQAESEMGNGVHLFLDVALGLLSPGCWPCSQRGLRHLQGREWGGNR